MIWRRLWVRSDSTMADLHHSLQIVMNWADGHLHHFLIRGKRYGVEPSGAFGFMDDACQVRLDRFNFRSKEKFSYTYNYYDDWQLEIRSLQLDLSPHAEHILDWFHVTMRITMLKQMAHKFLVLPDLVDLAADLDRLKWYLWHGKVFCALQQLGWIKLDLEGIEPGELPDRNLFKRLGQA